MKKCWINGKDDCVPSEHLYENFEHTTVTERKRSETVWPTLDRLKICELCLAKQRVNAMKESNEAERAMAKAADPRNILGGMSGHIQQSLGGLFGGAIQAQPAHPKDVCPEIMLKATKAALETNKRSRENIMADIERLKNTIAEGKIQVNGVEQPVSEEELVKFKQELAAATAWLDSVNDAVGMMEREYAAQMKRVYGADYVPPEEGRKAKEKE